MNKLLFTLCLFVVSTVSNAADVFEADRHYKAGEYEQAKSIYLDAAQIGNPHAYYQLGNMYIKGLGVESDVVEGLIYFSLAAEYDFHNAKEVVEATLAGLPDASQEAFRETMLQYQRANGRQKIDSEYFPELNSDHSLLKITFNGKESLEEKYVLEEFVDPSIADDLIDSADVFDEEEEGQFLMTSPKDPFIILDVDIAADGTIRNIEEIQVSGWSTKSVIDQFALFPLEQPEFEGENTDFVARVYLGAAIYNKFTLRDENPNIYREVVSLNKTLSKSAVLEDRFKYAMALRNFKWLKQEPGEAEAILLEVAEKGHPVAMYEYGMTLYREQRDIDTAIYWIAQASKYGLARAEYRIGKILQSSPWVENDDSKALFWYQRAYANGHVLSGIRAADIQLTRENKALRNVGGAIAMLDSLQGRHGMNPEYYYLLAISYRDRSERDFIKLKSNLRTAISRGKAKNWDVTEWEALLTRLTTGNVYSCELEENGTCLR